jgi:ABC-2 type transport system ATP-binding protein
LTKRYGPRLAVDDLSFQAQPGKVIEFLDPNGAGKSTSISGPDGGQGRVRGGPR